MKVNPVGFRAACKDYWSYVFTHSDEKMQTSSFIVIDEKKKMITAASNITALLELPPSTHILHAWPGEWSTSIFHYQLFELLEERKHWNGKSWPRNERLD